MDRLYRYIFRYLIFITILFIFLPKALFSNLASITKDISCTLKREKSVNIISLYKNKKLVSQLSTEHVQYINSITETEDYNDELLIYGHTNPSLGFIFIYNLKTKKWRSYVGGIYAYNKSNRKIARLVAPPHFGTPKHIAFSLYVDDKFIRSIDRKDVSSISWKKNDIVFKSGLVVKIKE